jgi:LacI family transcriptional regulator
MATLTEVAAKAGVSIGTASAVLSPTGKIRSVSARTLRRVQESAAELGYEINYHARSMKLGRSDTIGVALATGNQKQVVDGRLGDGYFGRVVAAIEVEVANSGLATTLIGTDTRTNEHAASRGLKMLKQRRLDGLVVLGVTDTESHHDSFYDQTLSEPVVVIEYVRPTPHPVIGWNERVGVELVVRHLAELGHRELLWLGPGGRPQPREIAFMKSVWDAGLRGESVYGRHYPASELVSSAGVTHNRPFRHEEIEIDRAQKAVADRLAQSSKPFPTAIVAYNDVMAVGAYRALAAGGLRVGVDVSVASFDNAYAPFMSPGLTSVDHVLPQIARRACGLLLEMVNSPDVVEKYRSYNELLIPEIVVRPSSGPPLKPRD